MSDDYETKKKQFDSMMTLYGRNTVLEILKDKSINVFRLHLASSNKGSIILEMESLAESREIDIVYHDKKALSRISKNGRQDQGVAIDIDPQGYQHIDQLGNDVTELIGLDGVTNPQNLGMVIRSIAASPMNGMVLPKKGCAKIDPLVHKASVGTLFKTNIYHAPTLEHALKKLKSADFEIIGLTSRGSVQLSDIPPSPDRKRIFLLGNESTGLRQSVLDCCHLEASISMANDVESINIAAAATLVAFRGLFR